MSRFWSTKGFKRLVLIVYTLAIVMVGVGVWLAFRNLDWWFNILVGSSIIIVISLLGFVKVKPKSIMNKIVGRI